MAGRPLRRARLAAATGAGDYVSERFLKIEGRAAPPLALLARQEVAHLLQVRASGQDWVGQYDHVSGLGEGKVLEVDLGGGPRLLAHVGQGGGVTLLGMGPHGWFRKYTASMLAKDLQDREPLPARFKPGATAPSFASTGTALSSWANETQPEWLYFLDEQQAEVTDAIVDGVEDALLANERTVHFLLGGPGTGKTSVLLQLLMRLSNAVKDGRETWDVRLDVSTSLNKFHRRLHRLGPEHRHSARHGRGPC